jgi:hypothetical protein
MLDNCFEPEKMESSRTPSSNRILNFSPVRFDDAKISVGYLPYRQDGEQVLAQLRREHNTTHVFRRDGDSILAVSVAADAALIGEPRTIRLMEHLGLAAALVRNALLTDLAGMGRTVLRYEPLRFIARDNLLRQIEGISPPRLAGCSTPLGSRDPSRLFLRAEPFIAAIVNVRTIRLIERTAWELMDDGLSLEGFYVGRHVPSDDARIAPHCPLLGRVESRQGSRLRLTDSRDGIETVEAREVWPERRMFAPCLSQVFEECAPKVAELLERHKAALRQGPNRLDRIERTIGYWGRQQYEMAPGMPFKFGALVDSASASFPSLKSVAVPIYVFDQSGSKMDTKNDRGLTKHGPYTAQVFTPHQPTICVVCQQSVKGQVEQFLHKFNQGIKLPQPRDSAELQTNYFEKGFCRKYALPDIQYKFFLAESSSVDSYKKACQRAIEEHGSGRKWDLAFVQGEECFRKLPANSDPYLACKASFLTHQINLQQFQIETTRKPDCELIYILNNMGLATYAKLGGIPWLVKANPISAHELVIGLGCANVGEGRLGGHERFVGITTVFSADGNYHLSNTSKAVSMDEYQTALLETLRDAILKVRRDMNWQPKDHVRLVFHTTFKPFSGKEVNSIKGLLSELSDYYVEYAFVRLSDQHPYMLFDKDQGGVFDRKTKRKKGVYAPERGRYLELGSREMLLWLTGPKEIKRPEHGMPRPVLLSLHRDSTFREMTYLTTQVFTFACHSWRTFQAASEPVTTLYPNRIAKTLGRLSLLDRWNPDVMLGRIGRTTWFL